MHKAEPLVGTEVEFNQYICSKCRKMFFILSKDINEFDEEEKFKDFRSPCCKPYPSRYPPDGSMKDPHGIYIRHVKLKVVDISDEIALVAKRRLAAESGKPDPYSKEPTEDEEDE